MLSQEIFGKAKNSKLFEFTLNVLKFAYLQLKFFLSPDKMELKMKD